MQQVRNRGGGSDLLIFNEGEIILKEGQASSIIYILMKGVLGIYKGENKVSEIKGQGVVFGEMSSILGKPRSVTVKTETPCEVMVYHGGVESIVRQFPSITKKILVVLAERLEAQTAQYSTLQSKNDFLQKELEVAKKEIEKADIKVLEKPKYETRERKEYLLEDSELLEPTGDIEYMVIPPKKKKW